MSYKGILDEVAILTSPAYEVRMASQAGEVLLDEVAILTSRRSTEGRPVRLKRGEGYTNLRDNPTRTRPTFTSKEIKGRHIGNKRFELLEAYSY